jgi:hypothetical protein
MVDQTLGLDHQIASISEEETKAFVPKKKDFGGLRKYMKKVRTCCTCDSIHTCLKNFRSCVKSVLIICVISAGGMFCTKFGFSFLSFIHFRAQL